jgi:uncharacterized membrane protein YbaN (DUF454 family)
VLKILYIVLGTICICLGILGILVPGLPTTPFVLLAAWFYFRSSEKLYNKLINHKILGKYISQFEKNKAITVRTKIYSISLMWIMISLSTIFLISENYIRLIVISVGIVGTVVMGFVIKTLKK